MDPTEALLVRVAQEHARLSDSPSREELNKPEATEECLQQSSSHSVGGHGGETVPAAQEAPQSRTSSHDAVVSALLPNGALAPCDVTPSDVRAASEHCGAPSARHGGPAPKGLTAITPSDYDVGTAGRFRSYQRRTKWGRFTSDITSSDLENCFHLPIEEASEKLGVGLTVLKNLCRQNGIGRWPYRKVRRGKWLADKLRAGFGTGQDRSSFRRLIAELGVPRDSPLWSNLGIDVDAVINNDFSQAVPRVVPRAVPQDGQLPIVQFGGAMGGAGGPAAAPLGDANQRPGGGLAHMMGALAGGGDEPRSPGSGTAGNNAAGNGMPPELLAKIMEMASQQQQQQPSAATALHESYPSSGQLATRMAGGGLSPPGPSPANLMAAADVGAPGQWRCESNTSSEEASTMRLGDAIALGLGSAAAKQFAAQQQHQREPLQRSSPALVLAEMLARQQQQPSAMRAPQAVNPAAAVNSGSNVLLAEMLARQQQQQPSPLRAAQAVNPTGADGGASNALLAALLSSALSVGGDVRQQYQPTPPPTHQQQQVAPDVMVMYRALHHAQQQKAQQQKAQQLQQLQQAQHVQQAMEAAAGYRPTARAAVNHSSGDFENLAALLRTSQQQQQPMWQQQQPAAPQQNPGVQQLLQQMLGKYGMQSNDAL